MRLWVSVWADVFVWIGVEVMSAGRATEVIE